MYDSLVCVCGKLTQETTVQFLCLVADISAVKDWPFWVGDQQHIGGTSTMPRKRFLLLLWCGATTSTATARIFIFLSSKESGERRVLTRGRVLFVGISFVSAPKVSLIWGSRA